MYGHADSVFYVESEKYHGFFKRYWRDEDKMSKG